MNNWRACLGNEVLCPCRSYAQLALEHKKISRDESLKSVWNPTNEKNVKDWETFFESYCYADNLDYAFLVRINGCMNGCGR
jgi:hypothetical protein